MMDTDKNLSHKLAASLNSRSLIDYANCHCKWNVIYGLQQITEKKSLYNRIVSLNYTFCKSN